MHQNNTHQAAWLNCIRQILEQNGFGYVWLDQGLNIDHMYVKDTLYSCSARSICAGMDWYCRCR